MVASGFQNSGFWQLVYFSGWKESRVDMGVWMIEGTVSMHMHVSESSQAGSVERDLTSHSWDAISVFWKIQDQVVTDMVPD